MARPSKYNSHVEPHLPSIKRWLVQGKTMLEIADLCDVNVDSLYVYMSKYDEFSDMIKKGRSAQNDRVVNALYQKAIGYTLDEVTIIEKGGQVTEKRTVTKHYPPSDTALAIWLNNRLPLEWQQKQKIEVDTKDAEVLTDYTKAIKEARSKPEKDDLNGIIEETD